MIEKKARFFNASIVIIISAMLFLLSSCTSLIPTRSAQEKTSDKNSTDGNRIIYFTVPRDKTEIWSLDRITGEAKYLHGVEYRIAFSAAKSSGFLTQETINLLVAKDIKDDDLLEFHINDLSLSPDKQFLAWREGCFWCVERFCRGQNNLRVMRLSDGTMFDVHQSTGFLQSLTWSPDSKHLAYTESDWEEKINSKIWLWDVKANKRNLFSEGVYPSWSASGDSIGYIVEDSIASGDLTLVHQDIETLDMLVVPVKLAFELKAVDKLVWAPRNEKLMVVEENKIWLFDSHSGNLENLVFSKNLLFSSPLWSPDGQWIAIRYQEEGSAPVLGIIDVQMKQIIVDVGEIPDIVSEREWSDDSQSILCVHGNPVSRDNSYRLAVIQIPGGETQDIPFPDEFFPEFLISKMPIVRGIQITW